MKFIATLIVIALTTSLALAGDKKYEKPPEMKIDVNKKYTATIDTTKGKIVLELYPKEAPKTVNSFVFLAKDGFYDGTIFHRVIPGFMIQGGDPTGTGAGGPGYQFENENKDTSRKFDEGTIGMANAGPDTNGSQFFIMDADTSLPPRQYTIFGKVTSGEDVVHAIAKAPTKEGDSGEKSSPVEPVKINSVKITEE